MEFILFIFILIYLNVIAIRKFRKGANSPLFFFFYFFLHLLKRPGKSIDVLEGLHFSRLNFGFSMS